MTKERDMMKRLDVCRQDQTPKASDKENKHEDKIHRELHRVPKLGLPEIEGLMASTEKSTSRTIRTFSSTSAPLSIPTLPPADKVFRDIAKLLFPNTNLANIRLPTFPPLGPTTTTTMSSPSTTTSSTTVETKTTDVRDSETIKIQTYR